MANPKKNKGHKKASSKAKKQTLTTREKVERAQFLLLLEDRRD